MFQAARAGVRAPVGDFVGTKGQLLLHARARGCALSDNSQQADLLLESLLLSRCSATQTGIALATLEAALNARTRKEYCRRRRRCRHESGHRKALECRRVSRDHLSFGGGRAEGG